MRRFLSEQTERAGVAVLPVQAGTAREERHVLHAVLRINMHLVGEVRAALAALPGESRRDEAARRCYMALLLTEIAARTIKNLVRSSFRRASRRGSAGAPPASAKHSEFANALLGYLSAAFAPGSSRTGARSAGRRCPRGRVEPGRRPRGPPQGRCTCGWGIAPAREQQGTFDLLRHGLLSEFSLSERSHASEARTPGSRRGASASCASCSRACPTCSGSSSARGDGVVLPLLARGWEWRSTRGVVRLRPVSKTLGGFSYMEGCRLALARAVLDRRRADVGRVKWFGRGAASLAGRGQRRAARNARERPRRATRSGTRRARRRGEPRAT